MNIDELSEIAGVSFRNGKNFLGRNEEEILNSIEGENEILIQRQKPIRCENNKLYYLDGYDITNNIAYEINEIQHFNSKGKLNIIDLVRQNQIEKILNCKFVRIKDEIDKRKNNFN